MDHELTVPGACANLRDRSVSCSTDWYRFRVTRRAQALGGGSVARKRSTKNFERALQEFEGLVARMEEGDLSLEESLKAYERGIQLSRACQLALDDAEQRIQVLSEQDGKLEIESFETDDE